MKVGCEVCEGYAWCVYRRIFFIRYRVCIDCVMELRQLLPGGVKKR